MGLWKSGRYLSGIQRSGWNRRDFWPTQHWWRRSAVRRGSALCIRPVSGLVRGSEQVLDLLNPFSFQFLHTFTEAHRLVHFGATDSHAKKERKRHTPVHQKSVRQQPPSFLFEVFVERKALRSSASKENERKENLPVFVKSVKRKWFSLEVFGGKNKKAHRKAKKKKKQKRKGKGEL